MIIEQWIYNYYNVFYYQFLIINSLPYSTTHSVVKKSAFNRSLNAALAAGNSPLLHVHWMITPIQIHVCLKLIQLTERLFYVYSCLGICPLLKNGKTTQLKSSSELLASWFYIWPLFWAISVLLYDQNLSKLGQYTVKTPSF